jgi:Phenazine biosynthesis-like protein
MADVRGPPPRCTEITCTARFICILDRGRFWGSTQAEPVDPAPAQDEAERNVGRERTFAQVDVFAATPYGGNPVAVVLDGDGLTDTDMARFAQGTNLGETT